MTEKWDGPAVLGAAVVAVIFGSLAITIGDGWKVVADSQGQTWAAWFQAFGSVAAILVAVWLHERSDRDGNKRAQGHAVIFRAGLTDLLLACSTAAQRRDRDVLGDCIFVAKDIAHLGQSIQLDRLDDITMIRVSQWRTLAARTQSLLEQWKAQPHLNGLDYAGMRQEFDSLMAKVVSNV